MSIAVTPTVVQDIVDSAEERELWIVGREHEREPYFFPGKGGDTRLARALRVCVENRIMPNGDGTYMVEGSEHRTYRVGDSCSCPNSQKTRTKWCYHMVAVTVYIEWQRRIRNAAPVELGTLRAGTLPLGEEQGVGSKGVREEGDTPTPAPLLPAAFLSDVTQDELMADEEEVSQITHQRLAKEAPTAALGDVMTEDAYIPEPEGEEAPIAVLEAPTAVPALRPRTPQVDDLEAALQVWTTERAVVQRFLKQELKANIDYYTLRIGGKDSKPSLSKAGAEKVLGWQRWSASFAPDTGTWEMLGRPTDLVCYVCTLRTRSGEIVGEGRGARSLKKDGGDVNKAIKMAEKSAMVSSVLRTGAISDCFTQDLEDMQEEPAPAKHVPAKLTPESADLRKRIWAQVNTQAPHVKTQDDAEAWVKERTGLAMEPDHYHAILETLTAVGR